MDLNFLILLIVVVAGFAGMFWFLKQRVTEKKDDGTGLVMLQNQLKDIRTELDTKLSDSAKMLQGQFGQSAKIIGDVTEKLTKLDETNRQVLNFSEQLKQLQDVLKNPKGRGVLGEYYLETVLKNVLPEGSFQMQYAFKNGEIVDAAVFVKDKVIPIDSKFSLENYNRLAETHDQAERERLEKVFVNDLKLRIQETSKYIRPGEGTLDFAFMFIPHEAIYYDLLVNKVGMIGEESENLIQRAARQYHVIIVSPTSFLAYLQTVLQGLKALQIEESAKEIRKAVEQLGRHLISYKTYMNKLGNNLGTTVNMYNSARTEFGKIDKDILKISEGEVKIGLEQRTLEKPEVEE